MRGRISEALHLLISRLPNACPLPQPASRNLRRRPHVELARAPIACQPEDVRYRDALGTATARARDHSTVLLVRLDGQAIAVPTMRNGLRIIFPPKIDFPTWRGFRHGTRAHMGLRSTPARTLQRDSRSQVTHEPKCLESDRTVLGPSLCRSKRPWEGNGQAWWEEARLMQPISNRSAHMCSSPAVLLAALRPRAERKV